MGDRLSALHRKSCPPPRPLHGLCSSVRCPTPCPSLPLPLALSPPPTLSVPNWNMPRRMFLSFACRMSLSTPSLSSGDEYISGNLYRPARNKRCVRNGQKRPDHRSAVHCPLALCTRAGVGFGGDRRASPSTCTGRSGRGRAGQGSTLSRVAQRDATGKGYSTRANSPSNKPIDMHRSF